MYEKTLFHKEWQIKNRPLSERWEGATSYDQIVRRAKEAPDKPSLSFQIKSGVKDRAETLTREGMRARVAQCANALRKLGVGEKDCVAYLLPNCTEAVIINQGGMTAGIVNPINPLISAEHIGGIMKEAGAKVLVTLAPFPKSEVAQLAAEALQFAPNVKTVLTVDLLRYLDPPTSWLVPLLRPKVKWPSSVEVKSFNDTLDAEPTELEFKLSTKDRLCAYFHTGGTTGRPKLVGHTQSGALYNGWLGERLIYNDQDVIICPLPMFHVFAAYPILMASIMAGAHMVMVTPAGYRGDGVFDNFWKLVERWKVSIMIMVPTAAARLMQTPINVDVSSLRIAICGSAPLPLALFERFEKETGVDILEGYGMTEATCLVSVNPIDAERKVGSVGLPLPYTDVKILECDANGKIKKKCKTNEIGEICVANPGTNVGKTYIVKSDNKSAVADGKYMRTGDLGKFDSDGFLWITGRAKDLIIRGGHNIDPAVIEESLAAHPGVGFVGAIGQPDPYAGELPCAYVELVEGADVSVDELNAYASEHIAEDAAVPKYIEVMAELPKTAVGKVFKPDLRRMAIKRVLNGSLAEAGVSAKVAHVEEDKKRGLVAHIEKTGACNEKDIKACLDEFAVKYSVV